MEYLKEKRKLYGGDCSFVLIEDDPFFLAINAPQFSTRLTGGNGLAISIDRFCLQIYSRFAR